MSAEFRYCYTRTVFLFWECVFDSFGTTTSTGRLGRPRQRFIHHILIDMGGKEGKLDGKGWR
jgi:hypothetical protein